MLVKPMSRLDIVSKKFFHYNLCVPSHLTTTYPYSKAIERVDSVSDDICHETSCGECPWFSDNLIGAYHELLESMAEGIPK